MNGSGVYISPTSDISQNPIYGFSNSNTFNVQLIITDLYGCIDSITNPIDINPGPIVTFITDTVCEGNPTTFTDQTTIDPSLGGTLAAWNWQFGDGNTDNIQHPTHTYANAGVYSTILTVTDVNGCIGDLSLIHI